MSTYFAVNKYKKSNLTSFIFELILQTTAYLFLLQPENLVTKSLNGEFLQQMTKLTDPGGCLPLPWGYIHTHVYDHHFQKSSSLKPLGQSLPNFVWSLLGKGERKFI